MATASELRIFLAGRVAVENHGLSLDEGRFPGRQGRLLFAYLVAEQGRPVPRDELAEALWGEAPPATWEKALTVLVSKLRALLASGGDGATALRGAFGCYRLDLPEGTWVDVIAAANAAHEAEDALAAGDLERAKDAAAVAATLLRQPFLPGEDGVWVEQKRRELADLRGRALGALAEACLRSGDPADAASWAEEAIALAPFRETGYRHLMEAHVAAGNRAEALQVYERCRLLLAEELGTYPSPETESVYRGLLEAPAAPSAADPPPPGAPAGGRAAARRRLVLVAAGAAIATAAAGAVVFLTGGGSAQRVPEVSADAVGSFDPGSGRLTGQIPVDASPSAVAAGDGSIWVANGDANSVSRIDPVGRVTTDTIQVGNGPAGIAFGGGSIWVSNGLDGTVWRINPQTNTTVQQITVGNGPAGVAVDSRYVWVANSRDGTVTRIDRRTGKPLGAIAVAASADSVAIGFGSVWVTSASSGSVTRIDQRSLSPIASIVTGSGADAVAVGLDAVWVANSLDGTVTRIDPATNTTRATIPVGDGPSGIAIVDDGAVWVSNELAGTLTKIDPATNMPAEAVTTGNRPEGIVANAGALFVAVRASGVGHRGGTLRVLDSAGDLAHLDPALAYSFGESQVTVMTNDGLTAYRRTGGTNGTTLVPDLAVSLPAPTDGNRSYTFQLRPGIRYSTGALVRPQDFRRAIERVFDLAAAHEPAFYAHYYAGIVGARRCLTARKQPCDLSSGIVTDPVSNTVTFHLTSPDPDLTSELALPSAAAVPAGTPLHPRGPVPATGPYQIASFAPGHSLRLVRNPWFREWSRAAQPDGFPDVIVERSNNASDADISAVMRGSADLATQLNISNPSPALIATVRTQHPGQLEVSPWDTTAFVALNTRIPPFDDVRVRQALNFAIDRRRLADLTIGRGQGLGHLTCQILPPDFYGHRPYCPYTAEPGRGGAWTAPDLQRAQRLVRASGTAGQAVVFWVPTWSHFRAPAGRYVVSVLESLGYRARFRFGNPYPNEDRLRFQAGFSGWYPDFATPYSFIAPILTCGSYDRVNSQNQNFAEFCDRAIDREIARAQSLQTIDPQTASRLWTKIDRDLTDRAPWVPYANGIALEVKSARVGNYQYNPQWGTLLDQLWVR